MTKWWEVSIKTTEMTTLQPAECPPRTCAFLLRRAVKLWTYRPVDEAPVDAKGIPLPLSDIDTCGTRTGHDKLEPWSSVLLVVINQVITEHMKQCHMLAHALMSCSSRDCAMALPWDHITPRGLPRQGKLTKLDCITNRREHFDPRVRPQKQKSPSQEGTANSPNLKGRAPDCGGEAPRGDTNC